MVTSRSPTGLLWLLMVLAAGSLVASGIYLGMMRLEGISTGRLIRAILFGGLGILWLLMTYKARKNVG